MDAISIFLTRHASCKHYHVEHITESKRLNGDDLTEFLGLRNTIIIEDDNDDDDDSSLTCVQYRIDDYYVAYGQAKRAIKTYSDAVNTVVAGDETAHEAAVKAQRTNILNEHTVHYGKCRLRAKANVDMEEEPVEKDGRSPSRNPSLSPPPSTLSTPKATPTPEGTPSPIPPPPSRKRRAPPTKPASSPAKKSKTARAKVQNSPPTKRVLRSRKSKAS
ncbi:hypothetical protein H2201_009251 [Coniosporium apollinis]|uniref:Uncharacterized protein n=1 Tax=Coniosporium apollinis TaxID=61459 RepID=A0ABQ9NHL1_9PEZI|nr:hypothetical protein H2201_009251 [Coniosporium apollinis]